MGAVYFASDIHLGLPAPKEGECRERLFVSWLDSIKDDADEIFLVGDIFDFWYEYKRVVPKGFTRFLGKIAEITDSGIPVHFFTGNHDIWMFDYLEKEIGVQIHREPMVRQMGDKQFYIAHGDGLIKGDRGYNMLKSIFTSRVLQWMFSRLHPNFALRIGHRWSLNSRNSKDITYNFKGDVEPIVHFANELVSSRPLDYLVLGHWHVPVIHPLSQDAKLVILGDWIVNNTYARWNGQEMALIRYNSADENQILFKG